MASETEEFEFRARAEREALQSIRNPKELDYDKLTYAPTVGMSGPQRVAAGAGKAVTDVYAGGKQLLGGGPEEFKEKRQLDAPLAATAGGQGGEVLGHAGMAAPLGMAPLANTVKGATAYGAAYGGLQPAETSLERIKNILFGGAASGGVTGAVQAAGKGALQMAGRGTPGVSKNPMVDEALESGYRLTPTQSDQNWFARMMQGLSGTAKMEKLASEKNAGVTNKLIAEELGLQKGAQITPDSIESVRRPAYQAYEDVKSAVKAIKPDDQFRKDLQGLRGDFTNAAKEFPDLIKNESVENLIKGLDVERASPRSMVELTRKLRKDASANLKAFVDPEKQALGMAQRNASNALEELIDRALTSVGKNDLVTNWRSARQLLAKTYDVESALNETTGNVSTKQLAKMLDKGKPLTGGLEKAGRFGRAFEASARDPDTIREGTQFGYGDIGTGVLGSMALGDLSGLVGIGARPATRSLMTSGLYQSVIKPPRQLPLSDLRNLDTLSRSALPLTLGGVATNANQ